MQNKQIKTYQENFITGTRMWMAENNISNIKDAAEKLNIGSMALYKIMDGTNNPTTDICITLCKMAGYSANWMFLNEGEMKTGKQIEMGIMVKDIVMKELNRINKKMIRDSVNKIVNNKPKKALKKRY